MKLYLCEKPSQGRDLAVELKATKRGDGFLMSADGSTVVTWGVGHLVEQFSPEQYDPALKQWLLETLPILPKKWGVTPKKETIKQYKTVISLIKKASHVVISTDADREGEMIARELLELAGYSGNIQRCWLTALDSENIRKALSTLKPSKETEALYYAALARSRSDWLIGMNFSRLFTLLAQQQGYSGHPLSVGRVQSPTLAMVVNRDREIANFIPKNHYDLTVQLTTQNNEQFLAHYAIPEKYLDEAGLCLDSIVVQQVMDDITQIGKAQVTQIETKREKKAPPLLFALSDLQTECNRLFGMGAQQVLDIAQSLYEVHKITTYPRTDCGYLPTSQLSDVKQVIQSLVKADNSLQKLLPLLNLEQKSRAWDDKKITAHHGIIPTTKIADLHKLSSDELKVYDLIRRRYLAQFLPHFEVDKTIVEFSIGQHIFTAKGKQIIANGWKILFGRSDEGDDEDKQMLPKLTQHQQCRISHSEVRSLKTSPPSHYTEGSLLSAMKNAARFVTDERLKQRLRETEGLGTEATRASLIQGLIDKGFLKKKGKQLFATEQANALIDSLPDLLKNPGLTALWEQALNQIAERTLTLDEFMNKQVAFIRHLTQVCLEQGMKMGKIEIKKCPKCSAPMLKRTGTKGAQFWGCSKYPACDGIEFIDTKRKKKPSFSKKTTSLAEQVRGKIL